MIDFAPRGLYPTCTGARSRVPWCLQTARASACRAFSWEYIARPEDTARLRSCSHIPYLELDATTSSFNNHTALTDFRRFFLHVSDDHYSCFLATLHTRHVCTLADATTRNQAKRLAGRPGCQLFCVQRRQRRKPLPTHRAFSGKLCDSVSSCCSPLVGASSPALSLRVNIPA